MNAIATARLRHGLILAVVLAGVCAVTAGCAPAYSESGQLARTASDAAAQAQTGALALRQRAREQLPSPAAQTAISDAIDKLGQDDSSLTGDDVSARFEAARKQILARVRSSEDLLSRGRRLADEGSTTSAVVLQLQAAAKQLEALQKQLEGSG